MIKIKDKHAWGWRDFPAKQRQLNEKYGKGVVYEWGQMVDNIDEHLTIDTDLSLYEKEISYHITRLDKIMRNKGFCPLFSPIEVRRKRNCYQDDDNCECGRSIRLAVYCYAAQIGIKLAKVITYIKDEDELDRLLSLNGEL